MSYQSWIGVFGQSSFATGPYSPSSFTQNAVLTGNGTSAIQASVVTITGAGSSTITGGAGNMTIVSGTGASRTLSLQTTTSGSTATNALTIDATQNIHAPTGSFFVDTNGGGYELGSSGGSGSLTGNAGALTLLGGAGNMLITAGTGNSRTITFQTTTSGGTATNALVLNADQTATFATSITSTSGSFFTSANYYVNTNAYVGGGSGSITLNAAGSNQSVGLIPTGSGVVYDQSATSVFNGTGTGTANGLTQLIKNVSGIADNTATTILTVTIPNAAHSATVHVMICGALGAGGAIGADEASGTNIYDIVVTRTAGVNATLSQSGAYGTTTTHVTGGATISVSAVLAAVSGAVGATNTCALQVTIAHGTGSSTNHTCQVVASVLNANASGITLS